MFSKPSSTYANTLERIEFVDLETVLDAGCGFGQWVIPLAEVNKFVYAIDYSENRVNFVRHIAKNCNLNNVSVQKSSVDDTHYQSDMFEAVFSYGVVFCTPWKSTLKEFFRILRPGGHLYFNIATIDWYSFLWKTEHNKCEGYDPREVVTTAFKNFEAYKYDKIFQSGQIIMEIDATRNYLDELGFERILSGVEGSLDLTSLDQKSSHKVNSVNSDRGIYEFLATKPIEKI